MTTSFLSIASDACLRFHFTIPSFEKSFLQETSHFFGGGEAQHNKNPCRILYEKYVNPVRYLLNNLYNRMELEATSTIPCFKQCKHQENDIYVSLGEFSRLEQLWAEFKSTLFFYQLNSRYNNLKITLHAV